MPKLTEKQKRFCEEYLIDLNATQSAIRAGYSAKTAEQIGYKLVQKSSVLDYLNKLRSEQSKRTEITSDTVLKELEKIALTDAEITGKEKIKAIELLGKHLGMFSEKSEKSNNSSNITFNIIPASCKSESKEGEYEQ